jgi:hypothetical protein
MNEDQIKDMLERLGTALSAGDLAGVSNCWELPALVLSDEGAIAITEARQIEEFFGQAIGWYQSQGMTSTRPELKRVDPMTDRLVGVDVRWPAFDDSGNEIFSEVSHYILYLVADEQIRLRVAMTRTS